jgi:hypothetical protein
MVKNRGQWERAEEEGEDHTHQAPRCIPGRHGEAVPAWPTRRGRGESSPRCTGSTTSGASTGERTRGASTWAPSACSASSSGEAPHQSVRRRQILSGESNPISSERKRSAIPFGGAGIGRGGEHFAQGGGSRGHRSWLERPGGGGDPSRQRDRGEREECERGWAGSGEWPRPEPSQLSRARVGRFGPVGQLGQKGFGHLFKQNF